jgi:hypothetical protein
MKNMNIFREGTRSIYKLILAHKTSLSWIFKFSLRFTPTEGKVRARALCEPVGLDSSMFLYSPWMSC